MPKFSVIVPTHNGQLHIRAAIVSVLQQDTADLELIVADDGSSDGTLDAVEQAVGSDRRARTITLPRGGAYKARDVAIAGASGKYIAFLDDDDVWFPWKLSLASMAMAESKNVLHHTAAIDRQANGLLTYRYEALDKDSVRLADPVITSTVVLERELYDRLGGFDLSLRRFGDWDLWERAAGVSTVVGSSIPTALITIRPGSLQRSNWEVVSDARTEIVARMLTRTGDAAARRRISDADIRRRGLRAAQAGRRSAAMSAVARLIEHGAVRSAVLVAAAACAPAQARKMRELLSISGAA